ncbi:MAG: hypothetical protein ACJAZ2_002240 [Glaciecola sp.]|jgi:hypothetical protein
MLQRIQSLYLLGTVLLQVLITQFTFLRYSKETIMHSLFANGEMNDTDSTIVADYKQLFIAILAGVFAIVSIAVFKNMKLQLKLNKLILFICVTQIAFVAIRTYALIDQGASDISLGVATFLIPAAAILTLLASKAIKKDEALIKSVDRIR